MRAAGYSDREVHDVVNVACCFAYTNRLADGLGVTDPGSADGPWALELMGTERCRAHTARPQERVRSYSHRSGKNAARHVSARWDHVVVCPTDHVQERALELTCRELAVTEGFDALLNQQVVGSRRLHNAL